MDPTIIDCLQKAHGIGKDMFTEFVSSRIEKASKPLSDVIKKAKLFTFTNRSPADLKKGAVGSAKSNATLVKSFSSPYRHVQKQTYPNSLNMKISVSLPHYPMKAS